MKDPIGDFISIRDMYIKYLDTAFRIDDPSVADERRRLLSRSGTLCTTPLLETQPTYEAAELGFSELCREGGFNLGGANPDDREWRVKFNLR